MSRVVRWKNIQTLLTTAGITAKMARRSQLMFIELPPCSCGWPPRLTIAEPGGFSGQTGPLYSRAMQTKPSVTPAQTVHELAQFAWCALVALQLARQDGQALSPLMTHPFLLCWLATAHKQRRFPRTVAPDIENLLTLGRQRGPAAKLLQRLKYLHNSCISPVKLQSELFRLTYAIESLKASG